MIRDIFRRAKQVAPTIIFFDEIDALAPRRSSRDTTRVSENVVSQLLSEMSGLEELHGVVVLAATNRPDIVDPALLRPGRFDRFVLVKPPSEKARLEILKIHTKNMPLKGVDLKTLAKRTEEFSGADLEALAREAGMDALREDMKTKEVKAKHFEDALKNMTPSLTRKMEKYYQTFNERRKRIEEQHDVSPSYIG
jgi:transitional endoplasmic reticulum ATPase